jgi:hypothetical protein
MQKTKGTETDTILNGANSYLRMSISHTGEFKINVDMDVLKTTTKRETTETYNGKNLNEVEAGLHLFAQRIYEYLLKQGAR